MSFPIQIEDYLSSHHGMTRQEALDELANSYELWRAEHSDIDAPASADLTKADADAVFYFRQYDPEEHEDWAAFCASIERTLQEEMETTNPWMPNWISKTDDRPRIWVADTVNTPNIDAGIEQRLKERISSVVREVCPSKELGVEVLKRPIIDDIVTLNEVTEAMRRVPSLFVRQLGTSDNLTFRWGPSLCFLAGLGIEGARNFIRYGVDAAEGWDHWLNCSEEEWIADVLEAQGICGYPLALARVDWARMRFCFANDNNAPKWLESLMTLHILKHCRFVERHHHLEQPTIFVAYQGRFANLPIMNEGLEQPLSASTNRNTAQTIAQILHIPMTTLRARNRTAMESVAERVFGMLNPQNLPFRRPASMKSRFVPAPGVTVSADTNFSKEWNWIDPQLRVTNVATVDHETGVINKNAVVRGIDALTFDWPHKPLATPDLLEWRSKLPDKVEPELPSEIALRHLRNINTLGHDRGLAVAIDSIMLMDLMREELAGSQIGSTLCKEFPIVAVYPTGHTLDETTNQGKTKFCELLGNALAPGVDTNTMNTNTSSPAQRGMAETFHVFGTSIIDEFRVTEDDTHFFSKRGIQALCTGAKGGPGRVMQNDGSFRLRHPLFVNAKVSAVPPDIRNRQVPVFMDKLTPETAASSEELSMLTSGKLSMQMRFSAILLIEKYGLVEIVKSLKSEPGGFRFDGHYALMKLLEPPGHEGCVQQYLQVANEFCDAQLEAANDSGLTDEVGMGSSFSMKHYWDNMHDYSLEILFQKQQVAWGQKRKGDILSSCQILPVMKDIVENQGQRRFGIELQKGKFSEKQALGKFIDQLRKNPLIREGWRLEYIPSSDEIKKSLALLVKIYPDGVEVYSKDEKINPEEKKAG